MRCHLLVLAAIAAVSTVATAGEPLAFTGCRGPRCFDIDADGSPEIIRLRAIEGLGRRLPAKDRPALLLLVEERLWCDYDDPRMGESVRPGIMMLVRELEQSGDDVLAATVKLYDGPRHKDGRIVLALRRYFANLRRRAGGLRGVVLIGRFPDAYIVRQCFWLRHGDVTLNLKKRNEHKLKNVHWWHCVPEPVADRADIVLADLDGKWDAVYREKPEKLPYFMAAFAKGTGAKNNGTTALHQLGTEQYEDFFYVNDGLWQGKRAGKQMRFVHLPGRDAECSEDDLKQPNPMARPEIFIARINTHNVAVELRGDVAGVHGERLFDHSGRPQAVTFATQKAVPHPNSLWRRHETTERRLLNEYLRRNVRYRRGGYRWARNPACLTMEWGNAMPAMKQHLGEWKDFDRPGYLLKGKQTQLLDCIRWLKQPALLRALKAHSDPWACDFAKTTDLAALRREIGGTVWQWHREGNSLVPGLEGQPYRLDFPFFQALYRNGVLPDCPAMYLHTGCNTLSPEAARTEPYNHPRYARWQHAEGMLYYLNGLVLMARAKTFNDEPRDFYKLLGEGSRWGGIWMHYFQVEAADARLSTVEEDIRRKKAYFWNTIGDTTLTMFPAGE